MLRIVENEREKKSAQKAFVDRLRSAWPQRERRVIGWRPDSREMNIAHDRSFWFASARLAASHPIPRYWNSIGQYQPDGELQIAVEINIPIESNSRTVSGFFARDDKTRKLYLMHDGGVGGGRPGVGRDAFLAWSSPTLVEAEDSNNEVRVGIIVTPLESKRIGLYVSRFARTVVAFKEAVRNGEVNSIPIKEAKRTYSDYFREFSGKTKGQRAREFEYIARHGDIVEALSHWRRKHFGSQGSASGDRIVKNIFIDLGIASSAGHLTELYEVKTNVDRQTLYAAIGQLVVHEERAKDLRRFVVLPKLSSIPGDVLRAFNRLKIQVLRFSITDDEVTILD